MRPDLAPIDQLLVEGAFSADDMADLVRGRTRRRAKDDPAGAGTGDLTAEDPPGDGLLRGEAEIDYALARFVAANCAVAGDNGDSPTPFVLKGGLAVYGCYRGRRRSRDADISPSSLGVEVDGLQPPDLLRMPSGMWLLDPLQETDEGWKVPVAYTMTTGLDTGQVICDLNKPSRAIRRQPAVKRPFESPFTTSPVELWVVRAEEIIGEKIAALLRRRNGRLRDIYDIGHLLSIREEIGIEVDLVREVTIEALQDLLVIVNVRPSIQEGIRIEVNVNNNLEWIADEIKNIGYNAKTKDWTAQVADVVPDAGTHIEETDRLMALWRDTGLLSGPAAG